MERKNSKQGLVIVKAGLLGGTALALVAAAGPVGAQDADTTADGREVIVVTAQRREQSILDVPASVSALGAGDLEDRGVTRLDDIASVMPNVYINTGNGLRSTIITVRGIASSPNNPGVEQSVGVFVDGVYQARPTTINTNVYDLERIEVIRGPQGALYGKNTIAGAVNFISKSPGETPGFEAVVSAGDYGALDLFAAGDVVFSPSARARVSVSSQTRDGFTQNIATGTELDDLDELAGRLVFVAEPSDALTLTFRADGATDDTRAGSSDVLDNGDFTGLPFADADPYDRMVAQDWDSVQTRDVWGASLQADWAIGDGELMSLTAYRAFEWYNANDNDYSVLNMLRSGISEDHKQLSQEFRYTSPLGGAFDYILSAFYSREDFDTISNAVIGPDLGIYAEETPVDIFGDLTTTSYAVGGQGTYHFNEAWSVTGAIRYSHDEKEVDHSLAADPFQLLAVDVAPHTLSRSDGEVTPSVSLNWEPDDTLLLYASYGRGYKSGGYNVFSISATDDAEYDPELVDSYEIGVKASPTPDFYYAGSVFWFDYTDLQVNQLLLVNGLPQFTTSNAASAQSWGIETEGTWTASDALSFTGSYSYIDATFEDFTGATPGGDDYSGNRLPQAPEHTFAVAGDLRTPMTGATDFVAHADVSYRSDLFFDTGNAFEQDAVTLVNARAGLSFQDDRWSVLVWGRNLGDETYAVGRSGGAIVPGQVIQSLGAPRTWGVELRGRF